MACQQNVSALLIRLPGVCALVGLSKSQIYRLIRAGEFPAPIRLGANSVAWSQSQISDWVAQKISGSVTQ
jgi:prophage regulatory protein